MTKVQEQTIIDFEISKVYDLIADFEDYPNFIAAVTSASKIKEEIQNETTKIIFGELVFSKTGINYSIKTKNTNIKDHLIIMEQVKGPFNFFCGKFEFKAVSLHATEVKLNIEYEFKSKLLSLTLGKIVQETSKSLACKFKQRAEQVLE